MRPLLSFMVILAMALPAMACAQAIPQNILDDLNNDATIQGQLQTANAQTVTDQGNVTTIQGNLVTAQNQVATDQSNAATIQGNLTAAEDETIADIQAWLNSGGSVSKLPPRAQAIWKRHLAIGSGGCSNCGPGGCGVTVKTLEVPVIYGVAPLVRQKTITRTKTVIVAPAAVYYRPYYGRRHHWFAAAEVGACAPAASACGAVDTTFWYGRRHIHRW